MAFATLDIQVNDKHFVMMLCEILSLSLSLALSCQCCEPIAAVIRHRVHPMAIRLAC